MHIISKITHLLHQAIFWLYADSEKAFGTGGFIGAGVTATILQLNYWYWLKVVASAIIGGLVNIGLKKLVDHFSKKGGKNER